MTHQGLCRQNGPGILAVNVCEAENLDHTIACMRLQVGIRVWLRQGQGNRFEVWGWPKDRRPWVPDRRPLTLADLDPLLALTDAVLQPGLQEAAGRG
jgi:hypothetical protein